MHTSEDYAKYNSRWEVTRNGTWREGSGFGRPERGKKWQINKYPTDRRVNSKNRGGVSESYEANDYTEIDYQKQTKRY